MSILEIFPKKFETGTELCACNPMLHKRKPELLIHISLSDERYVYFSIKIEKIIKALSGQ